MAMLTGDHGMALSGHCTVEDAEQLFGWLLANRQGALDLGEVTHLHTAVLQAIAATPNPITRAPSDPFMRDLVAQLKSFENLE